MTQYAGPPPIPPMQPVYASTSHVLHLILTLVTCGLWGLVWPCVHIANVLSNSGKRRRYQQQMAAYQHYMWMMQQSQH